MSIEEATEILNNAVITEPSIKSYTYISAEEINLAIQKLMIELEEKQQEIKKLKKEKNNKTNIGNTILILESFKFGRSVPTYREKYHKKLKKIKKRLAKILLI